MVIVSTVEGVHGPVALSDDRECCFPDFIKKHIGEEQKKIIILV